MTAVACHWNCGRPMDGQPPAAKVCSTCQAACVVCGRSPYSLGLCATHYQTWLYHRKPDLAQLKAIVAQPRAIRRAVVHAPARTPCRWCGTLFAAKHNAKVCDPCGRQCQVCGLGNMQLYSGLCATHYQLWKQHHQPPLSTLKALCATHPKPSEAVRAFQAVVEECREWPVVVSREAWLGELPLSPRIVAILERAGLAKVADVLAANLEELAALQSFGPASLRHVLQVLGGQQDESCFASVVPEEVQAEHRQRAEALLRERLGFDPAAGDADYQKYAGVAGLSYSV